MNNFNYDSEEKENPALSSDSEPKDAPSAAPVQHQEPQYYPPAPQQFPMSNQQYAPAAPQQPYAGYPSYQQQPYQQQFQPAMPQAPIAGYPSPQQFQGQNPSKSSASTISIIVSSISLLFLWVFPFIGVVSSVVGIIFGHKGLKDNPAGQYGNSRGVAITGMVLGYVSVAGSLAWTGFILLVMMFAESSTI